MCGLATGIDRAFARFLSWFRLLKKPPRLRSDKPFTVSKFSVKSSRCLLSNEKVARSQGGYSCDFSPAPNSFARLIAEAVQGKIYFFRRGKTKLAQAIPGYGIPLPLKGHERRLTA